MNGVLLTGEGSNMIDSAVQYVPKLLELGSTCFDAMMSNPVTALIVGVAFVGVGFGVVGMMMGLAKRIR